MKVLVTGCRGFIGSCFGRFASSGGCEVLGVGRSSQPPARWPGGYVAADVATFDLTGIMARFQPDLVFHAAGTASVGGSLAHPFDDLKAALLTWGNTLEGIRRAGLRPVVVFPSSAAVHGNARALPIGEGTPVAPISPYGFHKAACEWIGREYAECFGLRILVCRLFSVFGAAQRRLLLWEIYEQLKSRAAILSLQGTGEETRDYLPVDDLSAAVLRMAAAAGGIFRDTNFAAVNVASGEERRILDLAGQLRDRLAPRTSIVCRGEARPGDPARWCADVARLRQWTPGWQPAPFATALEACLRAWEEEE